MNELFDDDQVLTHQVDVFEVIDYSLAMGQRERMICLARSQRRCHPQGELSSCFTSFLSPLAIKDEVVIGRDKVVTFHDKQPKGIDEVFLSAVCSPGRGKERIQVRESTARTREEYHEGVYTFANYSFGLNRV